MNTAAVATVMTVSHALAQALRVSLEQNLIGIHEADKSEVIDCWHAAIVTKLALMQAAAGADTGHGVRVAQAMVAQIVAEARAHDAALWS